MKTSTSLDRYIKPFVVLLIVLWCGPEIFAVIELTALLELLGATLFLFAFATSFRLLALSMLSALGRALVPLEYAVLFRTRAWPVAVVGVLRNGVLWLIVGVTPYVVQSVWLGGA